MHDPMQSLPADRFVDGIRSITPCLRPRFSGWRDVPAPPMLVEMGGVARMFLHDKTNIAVISAVEVAYDGKVDKGPEYHISISRRTPMGPRRCTSESARWVLKQFGLDGAEEDNHVPNGVVRNFWRPLAEPLIGLECECKESETAIIEDNGDFVWRVAP